MAMQPYDLCMRKYSNRPLPNYTGYQKASDRLDEVLELDAGKGNVDKTVLLFTLAWRSRKR